MLSKVLHLDKQTHAGFKERSQFLLPSHAFKSYMDWYEKLKERNRENHLKVKFNFDIVVWRYDRRNEDEDEITITMDAHVYTYIYI